VLLGASLLEYLVCDALIHPAHANPLFTEAIACTQRSGDHLFACYLNNSAAIYALRTGDIPAARAYLQLAAQAMRAMGGEDIDLLRAHLGRQQFEQAYASGMTLSSGDALNLASARTHPG